MTDRQELEKKLVHLNTKISEAEARLGAHSVKPILMQQLFELEEERDRLMRELQSLTSGG